jgi:hypothetical protein
MTYKVEPVEAEGGWWNVRVNGEVIHEHDRTNRPRRFKSSIKAAVAGAHYVDTFLRAVVAVKRGSRCQHGISHLNRCEKCD